MTYPFTAAFRNQIAERCAAFPRLSHAGQDLGEEDLKQSAVAITLVDAGDGSGETAFLLTKRVATLRAHAGQWALPGGRRDAGETREQAALRELHEELGLLLHPVDVLGVLDDYISRSGYAIAPVVWPGTWSAVHARPATSKPRPSSTRSVCAGTRPSSLRCAYTGSAPKRSRSASLPPVWSW